MENQTSQPLLSLDDLYFKDVFTETNDGINIDANRITVTCLTSSQNKFHLDQEGNLTVNSLTTVVPSSPLAGEEEALCNLVYPVGAIYLSVVDTDPTTLFGGTWERLKDRFLLGAGNTYGAGTSGGEASHTLTESEMPQHNHTVQTAGEHTHNVQGYWRSYSSTSTGKVLSYTKITSDVISEATPLLSSGSHSHTVNSTGSGLPHNTLPPYLVVYMWKRTA